MEIYLRKDLILFDVVRWVVKTFFSVVSLSLHIFK